MFPEILFVPPALTVTSLTKNENGPESDVKNCGALLKSKKAPPFTPVTLPVTSAENFGVPGDTPPGCVNITSRVKGVL